jgi:small redox-active disulfide protein 2
MGKGPALALLLAGPALSLPNMLVIRGILGTQKTVVYCALVVVMATAHRRGCSVRSIPDRGVKIMIKFQVLGSGCAKCKTLGQHTEAAAQALGLEYELEKVTDMNAIIDAGVMSTPALDGERRVHHQEHDRLEVLSVDDIKKLVEAPDRRQAYPAHRALWHSPRHAATGTGKIHGFQPLNPLHLIRPQIAGQGRGTDARQPADLTVRHPLTLQPQRLQFHDTGGSR